MNTRICLTDLWIISPVQTCIHVFLPSEVVWAEGSPTQPMFCVGVSHAPKHHSYFLLLVLIVFLLDAAVVTLFGICVCYCVFLLGTRMNQMSLKLK